MKLSTRTRYGTRALLDLAIHQKGNDLIPLRDIARRQEISLTYLEHIINPLTAAGIIKTVRGVNGGISLSRPAHDITLKEVVDVLEGSIAPVECLNNPRTCQRSAICATRDIWDDLKKAVDNFLGSTTLKDLVDKQIRKEEPALMYFI